MFLTKWRYWFWDRMRPARIVAREACQNTLICSLWLLEVIDCNENLHEGGHGLCQRNDVNGFGMARVKVHNFAQSTQERTYLQFIMAGSEGLQWKWV